MTPEQHKKYMVEKPCEKCKRPERKTSCVGIKCKEWLNWSNEEKWLKMQDKEYKNLNKALEKACRRLLITCSCPFGCSRCLVRLRVKNYQQLTSKQCINELKIYFLKN